MTFAVNLVTWSLPAIDCLTMLCSGELAARQLGEASDRACDLIGGQEVEPRFDDLPISDAIISDLAIRFISPEFPNDLEPFESCEKDASIVVNGLKHRIENKWRILAFGLKTLQRAVLVN